MIDFVQLIGWAAGALIAIAALPKLVSKIFNKYPPMKIDVGDLLRDTMIVFGNWLWVLFGYFSSLPMIVFFCSINAVLTMVLIIQNIRPRVKEA